MEQSMRPGPLTKVIYDLTVEEIKAGLADPFVTRRELDLRFGPGGYRPLPRHAIWQGDKWRLIDDGKRARTNALSFLSETLVTIPPELPLLIARALALQVSQDGHSLPEWFQVVASVEDWWKGYRQLFPTRRDMGVVVVALLHPTTHECLYSVLRGLPFGLGSAVNQFNRVPLLLTAAARRLLYVMGGHYVDDN
eukprot:9476787-Pyramimonas_sp.AAC.1